MHVPDRATLRPKLTSDAGCATPEQDSCLPLPSMVSRWAAVSPRTTALISDGEAYSYRDLDILSNRIGRYLQMKLMEKSCRVGVCLPRTPDLLIAVLGVLKAGYCYVPLDPALPAHRLQVMIRDAELSAVISSSDTEPNLPDDVERIPIETQKPEILAMHGDWPANRIHRTDSAYIMYTSGSTGQPKGVEISHGSLANFCHSVAERPGLGPGSVVAAIATISFDMSILELLVPLALGATIHLLSRDRVTNPVALARTLEQSAINWIQATPTMLRMLVQASWKPSRPIRIVSGGEALPLDLARILSTYGELWNAYGPTEATVYCSFARFLPGDERVVIGTPVRASSLFVLDAEGHDVRACEEGGLFIGGGCVGKGYWKRPELTERAFVRSQAHEVGTLYRTGDRAMRLEDDQIVVLGRADSQVKIRGYRVEPEEIEQVCRSHSSVDDAVVLVRHSGVQSAQLTIVYASSSLVSHAEVRAFLSSHLPDYMVPSLIVAVRKLPTLISGKVDRQALLSLVEEQLRSYSDGTHGAEHTVETLPTSGETQDHAQPAASIDPPLTSSELQLAEIWSTLLGITVETRWANWFELGGDSLRAALLFAQIEKIFGQTYPVSTLVQAPTLGTLADHLHLRKNAASGPLLMPLRQSSGKKKIFLMHPISGNILVFRELADGIDREFSVFAIEARGLNALDEPFSDVQEMAERYTYLIRQEQPSGPYYLAGYSAGGVVALEIARRLRRAGEQIAFLGLIDSVLPCEVERAAPTLRILGTNFKRFVERNYLYVRHMGIALFARRKLRNLRIRAAVKRPIETRTTRRRDGISTGFVAVSPTWIRWQCTPLSRQAGSV